MNYPEDLEMVARRVMWFGNPEQALEITSYFLTYLMNFGTEADVNIARKYYSDVDFEAALDNPAPGIFSRDAWVTWNSRYNRVPVPPLPKRRIPGVDPNSIPDLFSPTTHRSGG